MSSNIWTRDALRSEAIAPEVTAWRVVEAQHRISTLKLVDTAEEQALLEEVLDATKPARPDGTEHLHYLLFTPFRYAAANPFGSRFRRAGAAAGVFYAAASVDAALAEAAFYRLLFFAESPATKRPANPGEYTAFAVSLRSDRALDLTRPPLDAGRAAWTDPTDYGPCQALADTARDADIAILCYASVRDPQQRMNYAVLTPKAFAEPKPLQLESWWIVLRADGGVFAKAQASSAGLSFAPDAFASDPRL